MEQKTEIVNQQQVISPMASSGFQSRCLSRPSENDYTDRAKLVAQHPPALADMKMSTQQIDVRWMHEV